MRDDVRRPAVAGSFYPGEAETLSREVKEYLSRAAPKNAAGEIVGLVSPHAGYMYSGLVAAHAFKTVEGLKFDAVVIVAPSHRLPFRGASLYDKGGYETPLGILPIDEDLCRTLKTEGDLFQSSPQAHSREHSLEVQLPFLQQTLGVFTLVPILIMDQSYGTCEQVGRAIARAVQGRKVLLVASTDLSHYHSYDEAVRMDRVILDDLRAFDPKKLSRDLQSGKAEACGGGPVSAVMIAARELGATRADVLKYLNSGDVTGDRSGVVGYVAAAFLRDPAPEKESERRKRGVRIGLTEEEKKVLHQIARGSIERRLGRDKLPEPDLSGEHLRENRGAFVSLHKRGQLRGCIGTIQAAKPLHRAVEDMAAAAAFEDSRFSPLSPEELKDVEVEISALTPLERVKDIEDIEVGKHGLYIRKGFYSGLLLPQVATDYNLDRQAFLEETCRKAGLPRNAWKEKGTELFMFSAEVF